jgi:hypothetical protein
MEIIASSRYVENNNKTLHLFVDDVDGKDAESVMVLNGAGWSVFVERTLGHLNIAPNGLCI